MQALPLEGNHVDELLPALLLAFLECHHRGWSADEAFERLGEAGHEITMNAFGAERRGAPR
jgi:hypothetical protein